MAEAAKVKDLKGWFTGLGRDGDRSLEQQMTGLEALVAEVPGKTVLDAGCAEGLIALELAAVGAKACIGLEIVGKFVAIGERLAGERELPCEFIVANLNQYDLSDKPQVDIVLMLAILHKLRDPSAVCAALAALARDLCVIRLPPSGMRILDLRSGMRPHHIDQVMTDAGFALESVVAGPYDEWLGYFRRVQADKPVELESEPVETIASTSMTNVVIGETNVEVSDTKAPSHATEGEVHATSEAGDASNAPADASGTSSVEDAQAVAEGGAAEIVDAAKPDDKLENVAVMATDSADATGARRRRNRGGSKGSGE